MLDRYYAIRSFGNSVALYSHTLTYKKNFITKYLIGTELSVAKANHD